MYRPRSNYPYRPSKPKPVATADRKHPVREEIERCLGTYNLEATFEEDKSTLGLLSHVPGIVSFLCTIKDKQSGKIMSQGRGSSVLNRFNKFVERTIRAAFSASLVDGIVRLTKIDALSLGTSAQTSQETGVVVPPAFRSNENSESSGEITEKQKAWLEQLIQINFSDQEECERRISQLGELTREEASKEIQALKR